MKMAIDSADGGNLISAYSPGEVRIGARVLRASANILPREVIEAWEIDSVETLDARAFAPVLQRRPELLILGTGERQVFPEPRVFVPLMDQGIGYEVMDNSAACRTYNILLTESRNVALALII